MAITESEKLVCDTIRGLDRRGEIAWGDRFNAYRGGQYSSKCPIDAFMTLNDGFTVYLEVKESGNKSIAMSQFKDRQKSLLLNGVMEHSAFLCVCRAFTKDIHKNSQEWFEIYSLVKGSDLMERGSFNPADLSQVGEVLVETKYRNTKGVSNCGVSTRGNETEGIENFKEKVESTIEN